MGNSCTVILSWTVTGPHATGMVDSVAYHVGDTFTVIVVRTVVIIKTVQ